MQRLAFVASFLAVFITADIELFGGAATRYSYNFANELAHETQLKVGTWMRRH